MSSIEDGLASSSKQATSTAYTISTIISLAPYICGLSTDGKRLFVWDSSPDELHTTIEFDASFTATQIVHPSTYINKVVVASEEGSLQIWNIQTRQLIHEFTSEAFGFNPDNTNAVITCVVQSPAIDVLAIGFSDGKIVIFDIRMGEILLQFEMTPEQASLGASARHRGVTSLSFRTDNVAQTLASSDSSGNIALWDLDSGGKLLSLLRRAHNARIGSLRFLPGQPVLISSGADNAIREWIFDTATSPPRLLKERSGHGSPPSMIRYYGSDGKALLSSSKGDRTLRYTSIVRDSRSFELSQGSMASKSAKLGMPVTELRLAPIEGMSFVGLGAGQGGIGNASSIKREWDDVLTVHAGEIVSRTWSVENKRLGKHRFSLDSTDTGPAKATCVTACGNFGLVGYEHADRVVMWNMQSGIKRREFKLPKIASKGGRHVTSIQTDSVNTAVIVSTLAGTLHVCSVNCQTRNSTLNLAETAVL
jgi:U3 small nucleolar RNA-associated protein 21